jgi:hypothetical protein
VLIMFSEQSPRNVGPRGCSVVSRLLFAVLAALLALALSPTPAASALKVLGVSAGAAHTCVLNPDGSVGCWGYEGAEAPPVGTGPFTMISTASTRNCGVQTDLSVLCWGGGSGPEPVTGEFSSVSVGEGFGCALEVEKDVTCWGTNDVGQAPLHVDGPFESVDAGDAHVCAIRSDDDSILCWGANGSGQAPSAVSGSFLAVSAGPSSTCAIRSSSGDLACWGDRSEGKVPTSVTGPFTALSTAGPRVCAVRRTGSIACFGFDFTNVATTEELAGSYETVTASQRHVCARGTDGLLTCWGDPYLMPTPPDRPIPDPFVEATEKASYRHAFTVLSNAPVTLSTQGTLPPGLTVTIGESDFDGKELVLSGTPSKRGTYRFTVVAASMFGQSTLPVTLRVLPPPGFDVNGDGIPDLPVSAPGEDVGSTVDAGSVTVLLGAADGTFGRTGAVAISQETVGHHSERGDRFGAAMATGEVTGDAYIDLIIGIPGEDSGAGQAIVVHGSATGLAGAKRTALRQGVAGAAGTAEAGDGFGSALSVGNGLWVGAPGENLGSAADAGVVTRFPVPLTTVGSVQYQQGTRGVPGTPEKGDRFGAALAGGSALIGAPGEDVGRIVDAGAVTWQLRYAWTQDSEGVPGSAEAGDQFGAAVTVSAKLWEVDQVDSYWVWYFMIGVGAPGEDVGAVKDAGMVITGSDDYFLGYGWEDDQVPEAVQQNTWSPSQRPETSDRFGAALTISGDGNQMVVGAPGEDVNTTKDAGAISVLAMSSGCSEGCGGGVDSGVTLDQNSSGIPGSVRTASQFGSTLTQRPGVSGGYVVGAPGTSVSGRAGSGAMIIIPANGLRQELHQDSPAIPGGAETGDRFGTLPGR